MMRMSRKVRIYRAIAEKRPFIVGDRVYRFRADGSMYWSYTACGPRANWKLIP